MLTQVAGVPWLLALAPLAISSTIAVLGTIVVLDHLGEDRTSHTMDEAVQALSADN